MTTQRSVAQEARRRAYAVSFQDRVMRGNPVIHFVHLFMGSVGKVLIAENGYLQQVVHNIISSVWPISTHAHSQITRGIATMDRCFVPVRTHQHGLYCRLQK